MVMDDLKYKMLPFAFPRVFRAGALPAMTLSALLALGTGCGDDDGTVKDAGADDAMTADAGDDATTQMDAGDDAPAPMDAGDMGCTEGCDYVEVAAGIDAHCARRENGEVSCWGGNLFGQLGDDRMRHMTCGMSGTDPLDCSAEPVTVAGVDAESVIAGGLSTCATDDAGAIHCWGLSDLPRPGTDQRNRRFRAEMEAFPAATAVSKGNINTCVVSEGRVHCAGRNDSGQLGDNTVMERHDAQPVQDVTGALGVAVSRGGEFACAYTASGVSCWGANASGQLGDDETSRQSCGSGVDVYDCSPVPVDAIFDGTVSQITAGRRHACLLSGSDVYCWGDNAAGQVGNGEYSASVATPTQVTGLEASAVVAAGDTTCALTTAGEIRCWGRNDEGQLGDGMDVGSHDMCTVGSTQTDCTGTPVAVAGGRTYTDFDLNSEGGCAVSEGSVFCWGWNDQRQLGPNGAADRTRSSAPIEVIAP